MAINQSTILFCNNLGANLSLPGPNHCCLTTNLSTPFCNTYLYNRTSSSSTSTSTSSSSAVVPSKNWTAYYQDKCPSGNCLADCQNTTHMYTSALQVDPRLGNGRAPIDRFVTCANVPGLVAHVASLPADVAAEMGRWVMSPPGGEQSQDQSEEQDRVRQRQRALRNITSAVAECLSATCRNARSPGLCGERCKIVNLLGSNGMVNLGGVNACLAGLCAGSYGSLPFADADVVGIGVFASYIMQCILAVLLWFGFIGFRVANRKLAPEEQESSHVSDAELGSGGHQEEEEEDRARSITDLMPPKKATTTTIQRSPTPHQDKFFEFIVDFHKSQCYFSATLQIASLCYDIFSTNMLITFLLTPLATNGVLPVVFTFILLVRIGKASLDSALLTAACCMLASMVYWTLYSHIIPINRQIKNDERKSLAYQQFMYKLSALEECGGFSALAACPMNFNDDTRVAAKIDTASDRLTVLTPIIWSFSIVCFLAVLAVRPKRTWMRPHQDSKQEPRTLEGRSTLSSVVFWVTTVGFTAGIGMQLSLLSVATSLRMMDRKDWSFGQVVAVTIWAPPVLGYVYKEVEGWVLGWLAERAQKKQAGTTWKREAAT